MASYIWNTTGVRILLRLIIRKQTVIWKINWHRQNGCLLWLIFWAEIMHSRIFMTVGNAYCFTSSMILSRDLLFMRYMQILISIMVWQKKEQTKFVKRLCILWQKSRNIPIPYIQQTAMAIRNWYCCRRQEKVYSVTRRVRYWLLRRPQKAIRYW